MAINTMVAHRIPAGWYPDRENPSQRRWWNGTDWTEFYTASVATATPLIDAATQTARTAPDTPSSPDSPAAQPRQAVPSPRHSAATGPSPLPGAPVRATTPRIPVIVVVLLAALAGANVVLLSLLSLAR